MNHLRLAGLFTVATLAVALASCSGPGGDASVAPAPKSTPGPIVFTGSSITGNVMTLPCNTDETFNVSQSGYSGSFTLVHSDPLSLAPSSGTSATTFTVSSIDGSDEVFTVTATGANGTTGVLTVNFTTGPDCG